MNRKIIFVAVFFILISAAAAFYFRPMFGEPKELLSEFSVSNQDELYEIDVKYPQILGADEFNQSLSQLISHKIELFKQNAAEAREARQATAQPGEYTEMPFDFICKWEKVFESPEQVNFVLDIYYYEGGAHGMEEILAFNYDLKNKKQISFSDFLKSSQNSLEKVSALAVMDIVSQIEETGSLVDEFSMDWIKEGASADWENYKNFNFDEDNLIIYFQRYQVAAGAFGPITVAIPKETLDSNSIPYLR